MSPEMAGGRYDGRSLEAWTYYCGRAGRRGGFMVFFGRGSGLWAVRVVASSLLFGFYQEGLEASS